MGSSSSVTPDDDAKYYYFTIDDQLLYLSFFQDWGPLNLAMLYKACILIHELHEVCTPHCHSKLGTAIHQATGRQSILPSPRSVLLQRSTQEGERSLDHGPLRRT